MKRLRISDIEVCLIVFNEADILPKCINALTKAGFDHFTVLDMESSDGTVETLTAILEGALTLVRYPRLSLLKYGYAEARNVCASFAKRDWVLFVDADEVLVEGYSSGHVDFIEEKVSPVISIQRNNIGLEGTALKVLSVERHNRIYKPAYNIRWDGYIHEEIHIDSSSAYISDVDSALSFDHFRTPDEAYYKSKLGRYHLMLLRAFNQKGLRRGTNAWWYETYVANNIEHVRSSAVAYAEDEGISASFYECSLQTWTLEPTLDLNPFKPITKEQEVLLPLKALRTLHAVPRLGWTGREESIYWAEWDHAGEGSRSLNSIIEGYRVNNWHRFITPGSICIDVGAHSGDTAIPMALFAQTQSSQLPIVIAVEPNPEVLPVLRANLTFNRSIADFYIAEYALSSCEVATVLITDHANSLCNGGIREGGFSQAVVDKLTVEGSLSFTAKAITLSKLISIVEANFPSREISFIKLDCEGYDKEILRSSVNVLDTHKPTLFVEWFDLFSSEDSDDLFAVIAAAGYKAFNPIDLQPATPAHRISDLLCFHKDRCPIECA